MARRKKHEGHGNLERWLLTYADMITLLMAFFIMLYTMSRVDTAKLAEVSANIRAQSGYYPTSIAGFGVSVLPFGGSTDVNSLRPFMPSQHPTRLSDSTITAHFRRVLARDGLSNLIRVRRKNNGLIFSVISDDILFDKRSAALKPSAKPLLDTLGTMLSAIENKISIEGHTDESYFPDKEELNGNWHLSAERAMSVLHYFIQTRQVPETQMRITAWSSNAPVTDANLTEQERRKLARRVDVVIEGKNVIRKRDPNLALPELDPNAWPVGSSTPTPGRK